MRRTKLDSELPEHFRHMVTAVNLLSAIFAIVVLIICVRSIGREPFDEIVITALAFILAAVGIIRPVVIKLIRFFCFSYG